MRGDQLFFQNTEQNISYLNCFYYDLGLISSSKMFIR